MFSIATCQCWKWWDNNNIDPDYFFCRLMCKTETYRRTWARLGGDAISGVPSALTGLHRSISKTKAWSWGNISRSADVGATDWQVNHAKCRRNQQTVPRSPITLLSSSWTRRCVSGWHAAAKMLTLIVFAVVSVPAPNILPARYAASLSESSNSSCLSNKYRPKQSGTSSPRACGTVRRVLYGTTIVAYQLLSHLA